MTSLLEDIDTSAEWIAEAMRASGYNADFSPPSLWEVDRFLDDHSKNGKPRRGGLLAGAVGSRLFALGAYTGEVIRRNAGGEWSADDGDAEAEVDVSLVLPDGAVIWPVQRVMKRFANGAEDGVAAYGAALGLGVGAMPAPRRRGPFRR